MSRNRQRGNGSGSLFKRDERGAWIIAYYDHTGRRRTRSAKTTDKAAAERILAKQVSGVALRREKVIDASAESLVAQAARPIAEHLEAWRDSLQAKGCSERRVALAFARASRIVAACKFARLADVQPAPVVAWVRERQADGAAPRTINGHLQAFKQAVAWAVRERRLAANPLAGLSFVRVVGQTRTRRPLDADELARLIEAAERGPAWRELNGHDRARLYQVAAGTGFRAGELASLTPGSFALDVDPPTVTVRAGYSKRRRDDVQPIRADLAAMLGPWLAGRPRAAPAFPMPDKLPPMLRLDLRRARARWIREEEGRAARRLRRASAFLAERDGEGRVVDFHSLRGTGFTLLVRGGASVKAVQELARHSDPKLTLNVYTRLGVHDTAGALDALPAVGPGPNAPERNVARQTGTYGADARSSRRSSSSANPCGLTLAGASDDDGLEGGDGATREGRNTGSGSHLRRVVRDTANGCGEEPPIGLEPMTCALRKRRSTN